jgi:hypothetical protein
MERARVRMSMLTMALAMALGLAGCMDLPVTPIQPPSGEIYENIMAPLTYNLNRTPVTTSKVGTATSTFLLVPFTYGMLSFGWNPCGVNAAAHNGGITKVAYADYRFLNILGVYQEFTVIAHGE